MREIKFRAYNQVAKKMYLETKIGDVFKWQNEGQVQTIMQFTGLVDKNGVDIYEGDIIQRKGDDKIIVSENKNVKSPYEESGIVEFLDGCFVIKWIYGENSWFGEYPHSNLAKSYAYCSEIIGNIYQNPELINN
jgi:uncharacterized phage protein (TIGR01671 family)